MFSKILFTFKLYSNIFFNVNGLADNINPSTINGHSIKMPQRAIILYSDTKREYFPTEQQYLTEKDAEIDASIVADYLNKLNIETHCIPANSETPLLLKEIRPDIVFNLVGTVKGFDHLVATVPAMLELLEIPYTGSGILGEALTYNKFLVKELLKQAGISVPNFQLFNTHNDFIDPALRFPLISKLNEIHGSVEINRNAISRDEKHLRERIKYLIETYKQPILVEEFIVGREVTAILLEGLNRKVYFAERVYNVEEEFQFTTFDMAWKNSVDNFVFEKYDDDVLREVIKKAFSILRMSDYAKFDIRLDKSGRYYIIDSNSNPAFGPKELEYSIGVILDIYGVTFEEILKRLIVNTLSESKNIQ